MPYKGTRSAISIALHGTVGLAAVRLGTYCEVDDCTADPMLVALGLGAGGLGEGFRGCFSEMVCVKWPSWGSFSELLMFHH